MGLLAWIAFAQAPGSDVDPAYTVLTVAFDALRGKDYDRAVEQFRKAAELSPKRTDIRKNLAYTLLKTGDSEAAREQFGVAVELDPADLHVALEYAFLCYEARDEAPARRAEARRIFARVRDSATDATLRATAAQAFANVDGPLRDGIARWSKALETSKPNFSAHYELAQLAEQRDELALSALNYRAAYRLLPERKSVLLELARVEKARGTTEGMMAALLAASRGPEPRASELAKEKLPARYPFVYEFRLALELDPENNVLHRELAYLLLTMSESGQASRAEAEAEFHKVVAESPDDFLAVAQLGLLLLADTQEDAAMPLLQKVLAKGDTATANRVRIALKMPTVLEERNAGVQALSPVVLGQRSYDAGFLKDALRYFQQAHEADPVDASVQLKLGWTNNMLHDDAAAVRWFDRARRSADPAVAAEAGKAWKSLRPGVQKVRTTVWMYPLVSSRWGDAFGYGQVKTEIRLWKLPVTPYVSMRFVGDIRRTTGGVLNQSLSENAVIPAVGVSGRVRGATLWFESGKAVSYLNGRQWVDHRGGVSWARNRGTTLGSTASGRFFETTADSVFVSRFGNNLISYSQNKAGYTTAIGKLRTQFFWNANVTFDARRQYWVNFAETGPGVRFHPPGLPPSVTLTVSAVRGIYLINDGNPRRPNYNDVRAGVWYAFTK